MTAPKKILLKKSDEEAKLISDNSDIIFEHVNSPHHKDVKGMTFSMDGNFFTRG